MKPKQSRATSSRKQTASSTNKSSARGSRGTELTAAPREAADLQVRIAKRAYELFEQRGGQDGYALEDWLQAEREIRGAAQRGGARR
jgi:nicotinamidase-related amidase